MDIFIIEKYNADNISQELLKKFQYKNITNTQHFKEHCLSYLMSDRILRNVYKIPNPEFEFTNNKPYLHNREKFFSISHTQNYLALCFSDYECGIDIECIKPRNYQAISKRMKFSCATLEDFYYEWTKYEAMYKLNSKYGNIKQFKYDNSIITAVSENIEEIFEIYIQSGETFPNLKI